MNVKYVIGKIADELDLGKEEVIEVTSDNAKSMYKKLGFEEMKNYLMYRKNGNV